MAASRTQTGLSPAEVRAKHKERSFQNVAPYYQEPIVLDRAEGMYMYDAEGKKYLDFFGGILTVSVGHCHPKVANAIGEQAKRLGHTSTLYLNEATVSLMQRLGDMTPVEKKDGKPAKVFLLNSGTEGCMAAIRVARLATKKKYVIKMGGAYHGWSDQLAYSIRVPGSKWTQAPGIPRGVFKYTQEFFPNDLNDLERKLKRNRWRGGTAAVIIEPIGPESGTRPVDFDFNRGIEELCRIQREVLEQPYPGVLPEPEIAEPVKKKFGA